MAAAAAILFCRRVPTATKLLGRLLNPARIFAPSSSAIRSFNTKAQMTPESDSDEKPSDLHSSRESDKFISIFTGMSYLVDEITDGTVREDADGLYIRMEMSGLSKEHVKVSFESEKLIIIIIPGGKNEKEGTSRTSRFAVPDHLYKVDEVKAVMKDGVLNVTVPKVKKEKKEKEVRQVRIK